MKFDAAMSARIAFLLVSLSGCASVPQKPAPPPDAWILNGDWTKYPANTNVALVGKTGQHYEVRRENLTNLTKVFATIRGQSKVSASLGIVASEMTNAFATSTSGRQSIMFTLPMLEKIGSDEDALATTTGHELAHLHLKHGEIRQQRAESAKSVSNVLGTVLGLAGVPMGGSVASLGVSTITAAYSRDEEREADILGLKWAMAAGYSACFIGAMKFVAGRDKLPIPKDVSVTGSVGIGAIPTGFGIEVELKISLPGMDRAQLEALVATAHEVCPYSNATRNNVEVTLKTEVV